MAGSRGMRENFLEVSETDLQETNQDVLSPFDKPGMQGDAGQWAQGVPSPTSANTPTKAPPQGAPLDALDTNQVPITSPTAAARAQAYPAGKAEREGEPKKARRFDPRRASVAVNKYFDQFLNDDSLGGEDDLLAPMDGFSFSIAAHRPNPSAARRAAPALAEIAEKSEAADLSDPATKGPDIEGAVPASAAEIAMLGNVDSSEETEASQQLPVTTALGAAAPTTIAAKIAVEEGSEEGSEVSKELKGTAINEELPHAAGKPALPGILEYSLEANTNKQAITLASADSSHAPMRQDSTAASVRSPMAPAGAGMHVSILKLPQEEAPELAISEGVEAACLAAPASADTSEAPEIGSEAEEITLLASPEAAKEAGPAAPVSAETLEAPGIGSDAEEITLLAGPEAETLQAPAFTITAATQEPTKLACYTDAKDDSPTPTLAVITKAPAAGTAADEGAELASPPAVDAGSLHCAPSPRAQAAPVSMEPVMAEVCSPVKLVIEAQEATEPTTEVQAAAGGVFSAADQMVPAGFEEMPAQTIADESGIPLEADEDTGIASSPRASSVEMPNSSSTSPLLLEVTNAEPHSPLCTADQAQEEAALRPVDDQAGAAVSPLASPGHPPQSLALPPAAGKSSKLLGEAHPQPAVLASVIRYPTPAVESPAPAQQLAESVGDGAFAPGLSSVIQQPMPAVESPAPVPQQLMESGADNASAPVLLSVIRYPTPAVESPQPVRMATRATPAPAKKLSRLAPVDAGVQPGSAAEGRWELWDEGSMTATGTPIPPRPANSLLDAMDTPAPASAVKLPAEQPPQETPAPRPTGSGLGPERQADGIRQQGTAPRTARPDSAGDGRWELWSEADGIDEHGAGAASSPLEAAAAGDEVLLQSEAASFEVGDVEAGCNSENREPAGEADRMPLTAEFNAKVLNLEEESEGTLVSNEEEAVGTEPGAVSAEQSLEAECRKEFVEGAPAAAETVTEGAEIVQGAKLDASNEEHVGAAEQKAGDLCNAQPIKEVDHSLDASDVRSAAENRAEEASPSQPIQEENQELSATVEDQSADEERAEERTNGQGYAEEDVKPDFSVPEIALVSPQPVRVPQVEAAPAAEEDAPAEEGGPGVRDSLALFMQLEDAVRGLQKPASGVGGGSGGYVGMAPGAAPRTPGQGLATLTGEDEDDDGGEEPIFAYISSTGIVTPAKAALTPATQPRGSAYKSRFLPASVPRQPFRTQLSPSAEGEEAEATTEGDSPRIGETVARNALAQAPLSDGGSEGATAGKLFGPEDTGAGEVSSETDRVEDSEKEAQEFVADTGGNGDLPEQAGAEDVPQAQAAVVDGQSPTQGSGQAAADVVPGHEALPEAAQLSVAAAEEHQTSSEVTAAEVPLALPATEEASALLGTGEASGETGALGGAANPEAAGAPEELEEASQGAQHSQHDVAAFQSAELLYPTQQLVIPHEEAHEPAAAIADVPDSLAINDAPSEHKYISSSKDAIVPLTLVGAAAEAAVEQQGQPPCAPNSAVGSPVRANTSSETATAALSEAKATSAVSDGGIKAQGTAIEPVTAAPENAASNAAVPLQGRGATPTSAEEAGAVQRKPSSPKLAGRTSLAKAVSETGAGEGAGNRRLSPAGRTAQAKHAGASQAGTQPSRASPAAAQRPAPPATSASKIAQGGLTKRAPLPTANRSTPSPNRTAIRSSSLPTAATGATGALTKATQQAGTTSDAVSQLAKPRSPASSPPAATQGKAKPVVPKAAQAAPTSRLRKPAGISNFFGGTKEAPRDSASARPAPAAKEASSEASHIPRPSARARPPRASSVFGSTAVPRLATTSRAANAPKPANAPKAAKPPAALSLPKSGDQTAISGSKAAVSVLATGSVRMPEASSEPPLPNDGVLTNPVRKPNAAAGDMASARSPESSAAGLPPPAAGRATAGISSAGSLGNVTAAVPSANEGSGSEKFSSLPTRPSKLRAPTVAPRKPSATGPHAGIKPSSSTSSPPARGPLPRAGRTAMQTPPSALDRRTPEYERMLNQALADDETLAFKGRGAKVANSPVEGAKKPEQPSRLTAYDKHLREWEGEPLA